jgi:hypothetical protein
MSRLLSISFAFLFFVSACSSASDPNPDNDSLAQYIVEPLFEEFYEFLGGSEIIGHPISPLINTGQLQKQYFETVLMEYAAAEPPSQQFSLAPLGNQMGQSDAPLLDPDLSNVLFVDGYIIYDRFADLYQSLGGQRYVGSPLTGVRYDEQQNRVEQYFENMGFYINLNQAEPQPQLMAYGLTACADSCADIAASAAIIAIDLPYGEPFTSTAAQIGDALLGARIAGPYQTSDGYLEVIYENMVLFALPDSSLATTRAIVAQLGITPAPLVSRLENPNVIFFAIEGSMGHNIALPFNDFLAEHGGYEISGAPISEIEPQDDGSARQCFANVCLRYISSLVGFVDPVSLGEEYKRLYYDQPLPANSLADIDLHLETWEAQSRISSSEQQIVHISAYSGTQLLSGLDPLLLLNLPNGGQSLFQMPTTDAAGHSQITLPAIEGPNGTRVTYQICIETPDIANTCRTDSFLIWGN